jgi:hypothetical protein
MGNIFQIGDFMQDSLVSITLFQKNQTVIGLNWQQFARIFNVDPSTTANVWVGQAWHGTVLWVHVDTDNKYSEKSKNKLFKIYGLTKENLFMLGSSYIGKLLRDLVTARGYDSIESCLSYLHGNESTWKGEARFILNLREQVYSKAHAYLESLISKDGNVILENYDVKPLMDTLPAIAWPESL